MSVLVCVREMEYVRACGCETERKSMYVRKRDQEHVSISVCERESVCVDVKENGCAKPRERDRVCGCERVEKRFWENVSKRERLRQHHPIFKTSFLLSDRMSSDLFQRKLRRRSLDEKISSSAFFWKMFCLEMIFLLKKEKTFFSENRWLTSPDFLRSR